MNARFPDKPRGECTRRHGVRADDRGKPAGPATAAFLLPDVGEEGGYETGRRRTRRADLASRALSTDIEAPQAHPRPSLGLTPGPHASSTGRTPAVTAGATHRPSHRQRDRQMERHLEMKVRRKHIYPFRICIKITLGLLLLSLQGKREET